MVYTLYTYDVIALLLFIQYFPAVAFFTISKLFLLFLHTLMNVISPYYSMILLDALNHFPHSFMLTTPTFFKTNCRCQGLTKELYENKFTRPKGPPPSKDNSKMSLVTSENMFSSCWMKRNFSGAVLNTMLICCTNFTAQDM